MYNAFVYFFFHLEYSENSLTIFVFQAWSFLKSCLFPCGNWCYKYIALLTAALSVTLDHQLFCLSFIPSFCPSIFLFVLHIFVCLKLELGHSCSQSFILQVNWTPEKHKEKFIQGLLPYIRVTAFTSDVKYHVGSPNSALYKYFF